MKCPICHLIEQGNMDPGILFGSKETIEKRVMDVMRKARSKGVRWVLGVVLCFCL